MENVFLSNSRTFHAGEQWWSKLGEMWGQEERRLSVVHQSRPEVSTKQTRREEKKAISMSKYFIEIVKLPGS